MSKTQNMRRVNHREKLQFQIPKKTSWKELFIFTTSIIAFLVSIFSFYSGQIKHADILNMSTGISEVRDEKNISIDVGDDITFFNIGNRPMILEFPVVSMATSKEPLSNCDYPSIAVSLNMAPFIIKSGEAIRKEIHSIHLTDLKKYAPDGGAGGYYIGACISVSITTSDGTQLATKMMQLSRIQNGSVTSNNEMSITKGPVEIFRKLGYGFL